MYADRMGSITSVIDTTAGAVAAAYTYDSFGTRTQHAGSLFQFYGYTGREEDPESGLLHYRARAYDPNAGQFLQRDPLGFAAGDLNLYAYVWNDPYNWSDPSGKSVALDWRALTAATALSAAGTCAVAPDACQDEGSALASGAYGAFGVASAGVASLTDSITAALARLGDVLKNDDGDESNDEDEDDVPPPPIGHNNPPPEPPRPPVPPYVPGFDDPYKDPDNWGPGTKEPNMNPPPGPDPDPVPTSTAGKIIWFIAQIFRVGGNF